ncbi:MAG: radical SAM protein [Oscillospiraceae bacterium]|nr:radical SAM protein [Oscillospiraceae bacterium]
MHTIKAKSLLHKSGSGFGMNLYRGCTHGCIYCDSRSLCYGFTHPFEDIEVKENAPALLEATLKGRRSACMIGTGSMSDPYQPCEEALGLTRRCLELIHQYGFGAAVLTKSDRILRDLDLLEAIHPQTKAVVQMTLTTWDDDLCRILEPKVCNTKRRLEVLAAVQARKIPSFVWLSPILPFLNDTEENLTAILKACAELGVRGLVCFDMGLTLRDGNREYFYAALDRHFPGLKERYLHSYGSAYGLSSPHRDRLMRLFQERCEAAGMLYRPEDCFRWMNELPQRFEQTRLEL